MKVTETFIELVLLARNQPSFFPSVDEITRSVKVLFDTKQVHLWGVLSIQIFLDLQRQMEVKARLPLAQLSAYASKAVPCIDNINAWIDKNDSRGSNWSSEQTRFVLRVKRFHQEVLGDPMIKVKRAFRYPVGVITQEPWYLMKRHPLLCGCLLYVGCMMMQDMAVMVKNHFWAIFCAVHI